MFAVIETGGKQYIVTTGKKIKVEKLEVEAGASVVFDRVLMVADNNQATIGAPIIKGATVEGKATVQGRAKKVIVFKYHNKTRYHKKKGHRQPFTEVAIEKIVTS